MNRIHWDDIDIICILGTKPLKIIISLPIFKRKINKKALKITCSLKQRRLMAYAMC